MTSLKLLQLVNPRLTVVQFQNSFSKNEFQTLLGTVFQHDIQVRTEQWIVYFVLFSFFILFCPKQHRWIGCEELPQTLFLRHKERVFLARQCDIGLFMKGTSVVASDLIVSKSSPCIGLYVSLYWCGLDLLWFLFWQRKLAKMVSKCLCFYFFYYLI